MTDLGGLNSGLARLSGIFLGLALSLPVRGACVVPHYQVGQTFENKELGAILDISIPLEDFAPVRLACLAEALRQKYPDRSIHVAIFSARDAAQNFMPGDQELTPVQVYAKSKLHGSYAYDRQKGEESLFLTPDAESQRFDSPFNTRIDLPLTGPTACKLSINGRCLLEFKHIGYPFVDNKASGSGEVTVTGRILQSGVLSNLKAADAKADPSEWRSVLVEWTIRSLGTWRFEQSKHEDRIRLTYHFDLTDSAVPTGTEVQFRLPYEVRIEARRTN